MTNSPSKLARNGIRQAGRALPHRNGLACVAAKGVYYTSFVDAGAAHGAWSLIAEKYWADSHIHFRCAVHPAPQDYGFSKS